MRILEIKFERNWNFKELNLGIGILKIKFERNWNFEDYLRIDFFCKLNLKIGVLENYL